MSRLPMPIEIRARIEKIPENEMRIAHMYQYLVAGRQAEVCGEYHPVGSDAMLTDFNGVEAVLFAVKTAKRSGRLRPCAIPLEYEPWAKEVYNFFEKRRDNMAFTFGKDYADSTRTRYMREVSSEAFEGLQWNMKGYSIAKSKEKIPQRWRMASNHVIRKARTIELRFNYGFESLDLATFGGWTEKSADARVPSAIEHYLYLDIREARGNFDMLKTLAKTYFHKLCKEVR